MGTAVIIGTGPSLSPEQLAHVQQARAAGRCKVYGVNNAWCVAPYLDVLFSCNPQWWDYYYPRDQRLRMNRCQKWTWDKATADKYHLNYIPGKWAPGLSTDPSYIHYGHGSGYEVLGIAYHQGIRHMILLGYDLKYPAGYSAPNRRPGGDRHYFGEYPEPLQHWPKVDAEGRMVGLLNLYNTIDCDNLQLRITNCSPGSALTRFEKGNIEDVL
jgi:hypothetical protein